MREYIAIPNLKNSKWLIPNNSTLINKIGNIIKPNSLKAKFIWKIALYLNKFNLISLLFRQKTYLRKNMYGNKNHWFVIYNGADKIYQKRTIQEMDEDYNIIAFHKIACTDKAKERVRQEYKNLCFLPNNNSFVYPSVIDFQDDEEFTLLKQSPAPNEFSIITFKFSKEHKKYIEYTHNNLTKKISSKKYVELLFNLRKRCVFNKKQEKVIDLVQSKISNYLLSRDVISLAFAHGDFMPWNCYSNGNKLYIFDWEMGHYRIQLWDYFNFIYYPELLRTLNFKKINAKLNVNKSWVQTLVNDKKLFYCELIYLLENLFYFNIFYTNEEKLDNNVIEANLFKILENLESFL